MAQNENESKLNHLDDFIDMELLKARRIFISEDINQESAATVIRKFWYLEMQDPKKPILLVINSPGGSIDAGFAIWDQAKMIQCPVKTLITGLAASMGSIISLLAKKGDRFATPNSRIMIHQPRLSGVIQGQATDLEIQAKEMIKTREAIVRKYVEATGREYAEVDRAIDRDTWMSAEEAKEFGLVDKIVMSYNDIS